MNWLVEKNVILTGASSGIGKEIAKILVSKPYNCKVLGVARTEEKLVELKQELGDNFLYFPMDTSIKENWTKLKEHIEKENFAVDVLINNAGRMHNFISTTKLDLKTIENVMNVNYFSIVYSVNELLDCVLKSSTPAIINICSSSALCTVPGVAGYSASKAAVKAYSETLALDLKGKAYVSTIFPGVTTTNIFNSKDNSAPIIDSKDKGIVDFISTPADKMAKKIVKTIKKKKKRKVLGWDAKLMDFGYKVMPKSVPKIINFVFKKSKKDSFKGIYN